jgi:hypothetical protein
MENPRRAVLAGAKSEIVVTCDHDREWNSNTPLICCSAPKGYVRLPDFISNDPRKDQILSVADWMTGARGGAFVAVFPCTEVSEGLALVQADHDGRGSETFYQRHHQDSHGVWRDFYFQTVYAALKEGDALWGSEEIQIAHPINGGWDLELITLVLESIGLLADQQELNVKKIHIDCLDGDRIRDFQQALSTLNREQAESDGASYREINVKRETDHFEVQHPNSDGALYWIQF